MKYLLLIFVSLVLVFSAQAKTMKTNFGEKLTTAKALDLDKVIASYGSYKDKKIVVTGKVEKVCEKKGCWMSLESGTAKVRTMFKDYGFFVPKEILGKTVKIEGLLVQKKLKPAEIRHFMKDEGKPASEISKVKQAKTVYQFVAEGVQVVGS